MIDFTNPYYYLGMFIACLLSYLIGSLNWSIIIGKIFYKDDIRKYYSHNAGATNVKRKFGTKVAVLVLILDALKVTVSMIICFLLSLIGNLHFSFGQISYYFPIIFTAFGHAFPVYFKFKGGKCVSIVIGFAFMINPIFFIILFISFWIILLLTKYISVANIFTMIILGILIWIPYLSGLNNFINDISQLQHNYFLYFNLLHKYEHCLNMKYYYYDNLLLINISITIVLIFAVTLHKSNIKKLINKEEFKFNIKTKFSSKNNKNKQDKPDDKTKEKETT